MIRVLHRTTANEGAMADPELAILKKPGPIGVLATILLWVKAYAAYL
jgi:hypothetical protein